MICATRPSVASVRGAAVSRAPVAAPRPVSRRLVAPVRAGDADRLGDKAEKSVSGEGLVCVLMLRDLGRCLSV